MTPQLENVLKRLDGVRRSNSGWVTRCPAHQDRSPSLSIREDNGRILLHCFAGCSVEAVCEAIGITLSQLFAGRGPRKPVSPFIRAVEQQLTVSGFRNRLTPRDIRRPVTIIVANLTTLDASIARALALAVEGELTQVILSERAK